jgi:hypothetical protein
MSTDRRVVTPPEVPVTVPTFASELELQSIVIGADEDDTLTVGTYRRRGTERRVMLMVDSAHDSDRPAYAEIDLDEAQTRTVRDYLSAVLGLDDGMSDEEGS